MSRAVGLLTLVAACTSASTTEPRALREPEPSAAGIPRERFLEEL